MPVLQVSSWVAACDVCRHPLHDGMPLHFASRERLLTVARAMRWLQLADGRMVCPSQDRAHHALMDELMPPEPAAASGDGGEVCA